MTLRPQVIEYVPHGTIPDRIGFAPAIVAWEFARHLVRFEPVIISAHDGASPLVETVDGIAVQRIAQSAIYRRLFTKITRLDPYPLEARAAKLANRLPAGLFHAHQLEFEVDAFRRRLRKPHMIVVHAHVTNRRFQPRRGTADAYVAVSSYVRERLIEQGYPAERIVVVPNGVDTTRFRPMDPSERHMRRRHAGIPEDSRVLLFVGRKQEVKGFDVFLRVAQELLGRYGGLHVVAIGAEPRDAATEETYFARQQIRAKLRETGRYLDLPPVSHEELPGWYALADVTLQPSHSETQGMAIIEAMACGCVCISTNNSGIRESIVHGDSGLLLDCPINPEAAAALVADVLENDARFSGMRHAARSRAVAEFDWTVVSRRLEDMYDSLLSSVTSL